MTVMINLADHMEPRKHTLRFKAEGPTPDTVYFVCEKCLQFVSLDRYTWTQMALFGHVPDFSVIPEGWTNCKPRDKKEARALG